jgi:hypothetical protein
MLKETCEKLCPSYKEREAYLLSFVHTSAAKLSETVRHGFPLINREKKSVRR